MAFLRTAFLLAMAALELSAASLDRQIQNRVRKFQGKVSIYAKNLDSDATYTLRGDEPVRTASTIKLAVMVEAFSEVAEGKAQWSEALLLRDQDKVSGSGVVSELSGGLRLPIQDLLHLMIVVSDNTATNILIDRFTADAVNARMEALGFHETRLMRKVRGDGTQLKPAEGWSADGRKPENQKFGLGKTTPHEMVTLIERIDRGEIVSPAASREMIEIMKRQHYTEGIGRHTGSLNVASKSGSLDALRSDVGIVYTAGGKIAMAITTDGIPKIDESVDNVGNILIADVAQMLIKGLAKK